MGYTHSIVRNSDPRPGFAWPGIVLAAIGLAAVALAAFAHSFYSLFSGFPPFDDEGYILIGLIEFSEGRALYDEVFSQYGPFFFVFHWAI